MKKTLLISLLLCGIVLAGCGNNQETELLRQQNTLLQTQLEQQNQQAQQTQQAAQQAQQAQQATQQAQQAQAIIDEYTKECKKGYAGAVASFLDTVNNQCQTKLCQDTVMKGPLNPGDYNIFMSTCISRKEQGLATFDDTMQ